MHAAPEDHHLGAVEVQQLGSEVVPGLGGLLLGDCPGPKALLSLHVGLGLDH